MTSLLMGIFFVAIGGFAIYWSGKKSFERRNQAGVEEFSSYAGALGSKALEGTIKIAGMFSVIIGGAAILMWWIFGK